jgi:hypothetical protein
MLESIRLKFTETGEFTLPGAGITIFVGPNNSGKSLILREVERAFVEHPFPPNLKILQDYELKWPDIEAVKTEIARFKSMEAPDYPADHVLVGRFNPNGGRETLGIGVESMLNIARQKADKRWWATHYARWGVLRLDGRSRFNLTNDQSGGDLLGPPQNVLAHLFQSDAARLQIRALVKDAFGLNFVIDPTHLGTLRIRLSNEIPLDNEQSLDLKARAYHAAAIHIKDASDGVQAFAGIVTAVLSGEFHTILVDEPEAFLHPPLARKLGYHLATIATERGAALLAATHSPDFLMGCVQGSKEVRVVRLDYKDGKSRGRVVDAAQLEKLFKDPLMRSANAISGLFYDGVVVTESDNDRAFYAEIYQRMAALKKDYPSVLFINAQNKQTIKNIIGPLRRFGVPAAAISDIDIVKDGGKTWTDWLTSAQIPSALHNGYAAQRTAIKDRLENSGKNMKTDGGVEVLQGPDRVAADQLFDALAEYGVFAVRRGELEAWLTNLLVPGKKTDWTIAMLERLGSDPADPMYAQPTGDDVWAFIDGVVSWIGDAARKGTW